MDRLRWLVPFLIAWGTAPALAAGSGGFCATAVVSEPMALPNGSIYPPGRLTLCAGNDYSPVRTLHEAYVDRRPVAMLTSSRGVSEGQDAPFMMFRRDADGRLVLYGYAVPYRDRMLTYWLEGPRRREVRATAASLARTPSGVAREREREKGVQLAVLVP